MLTRRILLGAGAGTLAAAALGAAARAAHTGLLPQLDEPQALWRHWRTLPGPSAVVAAGVLAANPHNSQPWRFRLDGPAIELKLDERRGLGPVDPFLRQMWLGTGCALENMVVGAAGLGRPVQAITVAKGALAARLVPGAAAAARPELLDHISRRHTNRGPYLRDVPVPRPILDQLAALTSHAATRVELFGRDEPRGRDLAASLVDATSALTADTTFMRASDAWFRQTPREEAQHRDGTSLRCAGLPAWKRTLAALGPRTGERANHEAWLDLTRRQHLGTTAVLGAISVRDVGDREQLLEAGRLWQRIQLAATAHGLGFQPLDHLLELADRERQLGVTPTAEPRLSRLTEAGWRPALTFRLGWPALEAPASGRRALPSFLEPV